MNDIRQVLRSATAEDDQRVDRAFSGFDLADAASYRGFLSAHARVLPGIETRLSVRWDGWAPRSQALLLDLAEIGGIAPEIDKIEPPMEPPAQWGFIRS